MIAPLAQLIREGHDGLHWYDGARQTIEHLHGTHAEVYTKMLAACSPRTSVKGNITLANRALVLWKENVVHRHAPFRGTHGFIPNHLRNLNKILQGGDPAGPKVHAFYRALWGDPTAVTIDRWMLRAWGYPPQADGDIGTTSKRIRVITEQITKTARRLRLEPRQVQAAVWTATKQRLDKKNNDARPLDQLLREESATPLQPRPVRRIAPLTAKKEAA